LKIGVIELCTALSMLSPICKLKLHTNYLYPLIPILVKVTYPAPEPYTEEFCEPVNKSKLPNKFQGYNILVTKTLLT